jgi:hypothetical protein
MDHIASEIVFKGKKPSKKQVFQKAMARVLTGHTLIEIYWGENGMTLDKQRINGRWCGFGWIKDISADDIAKEINSKMRNDTLNLWNT